MARKKKNNLSSFFYKSLGVLIFSFLVGAYLDYIPVKNYIPDSISGEVISNENVNENTLEDIERIKIANWNLQIFGQNKSKNKELMDFYVSVIDDYDIVFIQEIRDSSETSFLELCKRLPEYNSVVSSRAGRTTSKEQYGVLYKKNINVSEFEDYNPDEEDRWGKAPY
jgi:hypothetical protein